MYPGYWTKKHTHNALKQRRRIKTHAQQQKELDDTRKELDDIRARLHKQALEHAGVEAWHCELEAQSLQVIDLLDDVLMHQKQFQQQLWNIESTINARQKSLEDLKQQLDAQAWTQTQTQNRLLEWEDRIARARRALEHGGLVV